MKFLTDIGANLTHSSFNKDLKVVIKDAKDAGVNCFIITGSSVDDSLTAFNLAKKLDGNFYITAGVHPHNAKDYLPSSYEKLLKLTENKLVVAIGECALASFRNFSNKLEQKDVFTMQIELSIKKNLPLFLHQRDSFSDFFNILSSYQDQIPGGVAHCFTGGKEELFPLLDLGLYIGITGWLCDPKRGHLLREAIHTIPTDRLLIETDAPYLLPKDIKNKPKDRRNEPKYLIHILERISDMLKIDKEDLSNQIDKNTKALFQITNQSQSSI